LKSKIDDNPHGDKPNPAVAPIGCAVLVLAMCLLVRFCSAITTSSYDPNADHNARYDAAIHRLAHEWDAEHGDPAAIHEYTTKVCAEHPDICTNDK
jgi:hypothetical protein